MKEKRNFGDYLSKIKVILEPRSHKDVARALLFLLSLILAIAFISFIISYIVYMHNYGYELNSYSAEAYKYIDEILIMLLKRIEELI